MKSASRLAVGALGALVLGVAMSDSVRRRLAAVLLPEEVGRPRDLVALVPHPSGEGGWSLDRAGNVYAYGNAPEFREIPQPMWWRVPFVAMACTPSGRGLWILDREGNIYSFGDAPEFGEVPEPEPWRQSSFAAIAATPSGRGVWIADRRGKVFSLGDAAELRPPRLSP